MLDGHSAGFGCFRIVTQFGQTDARGYNFGGRFAERVGTQFHGLGPLDGCEIQGSYGHVWPDRFGSHSAVELAFTERARAYFADRAAARDVALFVRGRELQRVRRLEGDALRLELLARGRGRVVESGSPPAGSIGFVLRQGGVDFVRESETGRRFVVEVRGGRIARQNLERLAFVF